MKEERKLVSCGECVFQGQVKTDYSEEGDFELGTLKGQPRKKEETGEMRLAGGVR